MPIEPSQRSLYQAFYAVIKRIPKGQVATYRQIAQLCDHSEDIRQVGYALAEVTDLAVPWHRVINSDGRISQRANKPDEREKQRDLLRAEGIEVDALFTIDMRRFGWQETPPDLFS